MGYRLLVALARVEKTETFVAAAMMKNPDLVHGPEAVALNVKIQTVVVAELPAAMKKMP